MNLREQTAGDFVRLANVRIQSDKQTCEKLGELLQRQTGLMLTGLVAEKQDPTVWRLYLTAPADKVFPKILVVRPEGVNPE
jgi:hypothetical protein